jgi:RNA polymerase sigma factor for flagellar operon FliA
MATEHHITSGLTAEDRYRFEAQILSDPMLGKWFADVCRGVESRAKVSDETLALMESRGLVKRTEFGWVLGSDGRQFARDLGLIADASPLETGPVQGRQSAIHIKRKISDVWAEYKKSKTEPLRNILMEHYIHLVRYNAEQIHAKLPDDVELDDLVSAGIFGLMDAINAFNIESGVRFEAYCGPRIRGSILDELRSMDWVPRLVRSRAHKLDSASKQLEIDLGRAPTDDELAKRMQVSMSEFDKIQKDASAMGIISLSRNWYETDSIKDIREVDIENEGAVDPVREVQRNDLKELMTKGLSSAERFVLRMYYFEEMTMREIATCLGVSESRVSRMHSSILARLKIQMANRKSENADV